MTRTLPATHGLPYALYRAAQVRALDACAIERFGIPAQVLMERAGAALWALTERHWPRARRMAVLAGTGNNGGDGYVLARLAHQAGRQVAVLRFGDHEQLPSAAAAAARAYREAGGIVDALHRLSDDTDLIVDALLGTGLTRPVTGELATVIGKVNARRAPVLAADIPSGLHADTGAVLGSAIRASATLCFIGLKQGLFTADGPACCGTIQFDGLQVPAAVYATEIAAARRVDWRKERTRAPARSRIAHKGHCGHVLVVGGAPGMSGAARLCGEAALRAGAGLVTIATHPAHAAWLNLSRPELMTAAVAAPEELAALLERAQVVALGPGLGRDAWGRALFNDLFAENRIGPRGLVMDADALNLLAEQPFRHSAWVLTPHPGEAARLLNCTTADIARDRFSAARALQSLYGGTLVLKGAGTVIVSADQVSPALCSDGNPGMASGGMGDALTGIVSALMAQGLEPEQAATSGVCLHAAAADWAARAGERGLLASDVINALRFQWSSDALSGETL